MRRELTLQNTPVIASVLGHERQQQYEWNSHSEDTGSMGESSHPERMLDLLLEDNEWVSINFIQVRSG